MNFLTKMTRRCFSINNPDKLKYLLNTDMDFTKINYTKNDSIKYDENSKKTLDEQLKEITNFHLVDESNSPNIKQMDYIYSSLQERLQKAIHK
tara:strand:- start:218 stop:496 length:279 start_codon:yes stop_codon:yes gene_type:complete